MFRLVARIELWVVDLIRPGLQMVIGVIFKRRAVHLVRPGFGLQVNGGAARQTLFGVKAVGDDIDFLERFDGRNVGDHVRQQNVVRADAVNARAVLIVAGAVDVELQRLRRVAGDRV